MTATPTPAADPDPAVLARIAELVRLEQQGDRAQVAIGPWSAYTLIGALQLSLRHPNVNGQLHDTLAQIAHLLADTWFKNGDPLIYHQLQRGFDPTHDIHSDQTGWPDACHAPGFRCPRCAMVSHNPHDEINGYCGACHDFTAQSPPAPQHHPQPEPEPGNGGGDGGAALAVRSELPPDSDHYHVAVSMGADRAWALPPPRAVRYAHACMRVAALNEQTAQIRQILIDRGAPEPVVLDFVVMQLIFPSLAQDMEATDPLVLCTGETTAGQPKIRIELHNQPLAFVSPAQLRAHAAQVLDAAVTAELHTTLYQGLTTAGADPHHARTTITNLQRQPARPRPQGTPT